MKLEKKIILYFSPVDWNHNWQRQQEFAVALARKNTVIYIEPIGLFNVGLYELWKKVVGKKRLRSGEARSKAPVPSKNIFIASLFFLPRHNNWFFERVNKFLLTKQLRGILAKKQLHGDIVLWSGNPSRTIFQLRSSFKPVATIYDNAMRIEELPGAPAYVRQHEKEAVEASSLVFTDNDLKLNEFQKLNPRSFKVPQGVDLRVFDRNRKYQTPLELQNVQHPIIGYYGSIQSVFDYDLYESVVKKFPQHTFVLVGPVRRQEDVQPLAAYKNVIVTGPKLVKELPAFLACFDVCLIPYRVTSYTKGTFPTKLFEYLSFLKPVVAEPIDELQHFSDYVYLAESPETFAEAITVALRDGVKKKEQLPSFVEQNTWEARFQLLESKFEELL